MDKRIPEDANTQTKKFVALDGFTGECACGIPICRCGQRSIAAWVRTRRSLNTAADKDRQIAILVEALEHYAKKINWVCQNPATLHRCGHRYECEMSGFDIEDKEQGWDAATKALAESKRIQEGK